MKNEKKIFTKNDLLKETRSYWSIIASCAFIIIPLLFALVILISYISSGNINMANTIGNIVEILFCLIFIYIGVRILTKMLKIIRQIKTGNFVIEIDKVIDKYDVSTSGSSNSNRFYLVLQYNKTMVYINRWKEYNIGEEFYVINLGKNETIVKSLNKYELDTELQSKVVSSHKNKENVVEKWEDD